ncbi:MAG: TatD family hydrolase [Puniceicoccales bacterium]|jgi:TatD DNase family protein|nr:TatD family hydrolase [Puniceicoccales bacterium]
MLIDSHCHLDGFARDNSLGTVLERAAAAGVAEVVAIGTEPTDWALYRDLADAHRGRVHHTVGLHPCEVTAEGWEAAVAQLPAFFKPAASAAVPVTTATDAALTPPPLPVAVGEIGLDYFHLPKDPAAAAALVAAQKEAFRAQLAFAREIGTAVVVHARKAFADCVALIDASGVDWERVVFHCFSEGAPEVRELNRRGGRASFTGTLTYPNAAATREACVAQGVALCMVETDSPYLAPQTLRGTRNEPANVRLVAEQAACLLGMRDEEFAAAATAATRQFYGL